MLLIPDRTKTSCLVGLKVENEKKCYVVYHCSGTWVFPYQVVMCLSCPHSRLDGVPATGLTEFIGGPCPLVAASRQREVCNSKYMLLARLGSVTVT